MKLATKIIIWVAGILIITIGVDSYITLERALDRIDEDTDRDGRLVSRSLRAIVESTETIEGHPRAAELLEGISQGESEISARLYPLDHEAVMIDQSAVRRLLHDREITLSFLDEERDKHLTYVAVQTGDDVARELPELLEVSQSTAHRHQHVVQSLVQTATLALVMLLLAFLAAVVLGRRLIGAPLERLAETAQRIARQEPHEPTHLVVGGELALLADEIDRMSEAIAQAREQVATETQDRIETLEQLRHADRLTSVGRIAAGIAHELGTPLNVIGARAQMIARAHSDHDATSSNARIIREQTARITKIIRRLLDFARPTPQNIEIVALMPLVAETLATLGPLVTAAGITVREKIGDELLAVRADSTQIAQVLTNLVVNAIDAMPDGGTLTVAVSHSRRRRPGDADETSCVCLSVRDEGDGMAADVCEHVFDPFFTTKDIGAGEGLGLAVSHGIITEHGGWFEIESEKGRGTMMTVYLPQAAKG